MGPIHRRAIEIPTADANAVALAFANAVARATAIAYANANAPLGEKKETPAADALAFATARAVADATANAPLGEKQMKLKTITVRSKCHLYQGEWGEEDLMACRAEWEHWKTKHEP